MPRARAPLGSFCPCVCFFPPPKRSKPVFSNGNSGRAVSLWNPAKAVFHGGCRGGPFQARLALARNLRRNSISQSLRQVSFPKLPDSKGESRTIGPVPMAHRHGRRRQALFGGATPVNPSHIGNVGENVHRRRAPAGLREITEIVKLPTVRNSYAALHPATTRAPSRP